MAKIAILEGLQELVSEEVNMERKNLGDYKTFKSDEIQDKLDELRGF